MKTTLNKIRERSPCQEGWETLLRSLGKTGPDDEPLSILTVLESNGLDDAVWCLRAVDGCDKEIWLYAVACARQVQHLMKDPGSLAALDVAEKYAHGLATIAELSAARDAARAAAGAAARDAATAAARAAAWAAARAAAEVAARAAARAAAEVAARAAARATARAAAEVAARAAATATGWATGWDAARKAQEDLLRKMCAETE